MSERQYSHDALLQAAAAGGALAEQLHQESRENAELRLRWLSAQEHAAVWRGLLENIPDGEAAELDDETLALFLDDALPVDVRQAVLDALASSSTNRVRMLALAEDVRTAMDAELPADIVAKRPSAELVDLDEAKASRAEAEARRQQYTPRADEAAERKQRYSSERD